VIATEPTWRLDKLLAGAALGFPGGLGGGAIHLMLRGTKNVSKENRKSKR
jgi:hypothetical protein